jgi:16S rRNA (cytosine1402-N4)-methyltransferase
MEFKHIPVMLNEVMTLFSCKPHQVYVDATLGGGGHALEVLNRTAPDGILVGIEWDGDALCEVKEKLSPFGDRVKIFRENFIHLPELLKRLKIEWVDGILLDLGLSSIQLDKEKRGFSFKGEGPLDMRMDQRMDCTAADLVNTLPFENLKHILSEYGEERWAKKIAKAIVHERDRHPIQTTQALRRIVHQTIPRRFHPKKLDPATKTFQALRIKVNNELENLRRILETGWSLLRKGGRICVISFHSLEDRIVKETFRKLEKEGANGSIPGAVMHIITPKPITPSEEEQRRNPRSRSGKLRCAERV